MVFLPEALGRTETVDVGGCQGRVLTPQLRARIDGKAPDVLLPPSGTPAKLVESIKRQNPLFYWGREIHVGTRASVVSEFLFEFDLPDALSKASSQVAHINHEIDSWFSRLRDWLEVLTQQDLSVDDPDSGATLLGVHDWAIDGQTDWDRNNRLPLSIILAPHRPVQAVGVAQWQAAMNGANHREHPDPVYLLLRDARKRIHRDQYAYAVIFAGTATEIVLKRVNESELKRLGNPGRFVENTLHRATLGRLISIGRSLGFTFPEGIDQQLVEPRNRAIHESAHISGVDAGKALEIANSVVVEWAPLPSASKRAIDSAS
ncbi:hypothetical protein BH24CHL4_BH24CHL4_10640 [soil metagenome]